MINDFINIYIHVSTSIGDSAIQDKGYHSRVVTFIGYKALADLVILDMIDFDVIMVMSWFSPYHAI